MVNVDAQSHGGLVADDEASPMNARLKNTGSSTASWYLAPVSKGTGAVRLPQASSLTTPNAVASRFCCHAAVGSPATVAGLSSASSSELVQTGLVGACAGLGSRA
jgi:hypothetical protein